MPTLYAQKLSTAQKKEITSAASVFDLSSQSKSLQRKADMVNCDAQCTEIMRPNNTEILINDNAALEHEVDVMGEMAVQKKGDVSQKSKANCNSAVQCKNCPAYFETENEDGCDNSKYFVKKDSYIRIAPINAVRAPNQEYLEEKRNFVYYNKDGASAFLENAFGRYPDLANLVELTEYDVPFENLIKFTIACAQNQLCNPETQNKDYLKEKIRFLSEKRDFEILRSADLGLSPFDWNDHTIHCGHLIKEKGSMDPAQDDVKFYKDRKEHASKVAKSYFGNSTEFMDACFSCLWYAVNRIYPLFEGVSRDFCLKNIAYVINEIKCYETSVDRDVWAKCYNIFIEEADLEAKESGFGADDILNYIDQNAEIIQNFITQRENEMALFRQTKKNVSTTTEKEK